MEGIAWYTYEVVSRMVRNNPDVEFIFLFDRSFDPQFIFADNVRGIDLFPQARHPLLYITWFNYSVPRILKKENVDVFFSPEGYIPLRGNTPSVNVIHDIGFEHFDDHLSAKDYWFYRKYFPRYAHGASACITVSNFSKKDICDTYGVNQNRINVVYNGARQLIPTKESVPNSKPYFLYIGSLHPRKNITRVMQAFDRWRSNHNHDVELLIVGRRLSKSSEISKVFENLENKSHIQMKGYLNDSEMATLLKHAVALVYVPIFEGFGLPILEAFSLDTAVISSNCSSIPEVTGDAALLVNPFEIDEIAEAMNTIFINTELRADLIKRSKVQLNKFSWDKSAEETWEIIEGVYKNA